MTRLAFLIGFAIGAWWVLRERRERRWAEVDRAFGELVDMCPNCVTPWKCNGPHLIAVFADPYPSSLLRPNGWDG